MASQRSARQTKLPDACPLHSPPKHLVRRLGSRFTTCKGTERVTIALRCPTSRR